MKKIVKALGIGLLSLTLLSQTSCIGSFALTNKVLEFNRNLGDKFLNEVVFLAFCIIPVYEATVFIDAIILNLVEFWTGSNPLAIQEGQKEEKVVSKNGETYKFTATTNAMKVEVIEGKNQGKEVDFIFNSAEQTFSMNYEGQSTKLVELNASEQMATVYYPNGAQKNIALNGNAIEEALAYALEIGTQTALK